MTIQQYLHILRLVKTEVNYQFNVYHNQYQTKGKVRRQLLPVVGKSSLKNTPWVHRIDACLFYNHAKNNTDGFTINPNYLDNEGYYTPSKGVAVGLNKVGFKGNINNRDAVVDWLNAIQPLLSDVFLRDKIFIGGWTNPETQELHLDIVILIQDVNHAVEIGKCFNQVSVYDLDTGKEHQTGGNGGTPLITA